MDPSDSDGEMLRAELERQVKLLAPDDQARLLKVIEALQAGAEIDAERMRELTALDLRLWADQLGQPKG